MRTIEEINKEAADNYANDPIIASTYGLDGKSGFDKQLSKATIENRLFYAIARVIHSLESIFYKHKAETQEYIDQMKPHSLRWYRNKTMAFLFGLPLIPETDQYDISGINDPDLDKMRVVKYCAVSEAADASKLYMKVAGGEKEGNRYPLNEEQDAALRDYLACVKDAGVYIDLVNRKADELSLSLIIYYNPLVLNSEGGRLDGTGEPPVKSAIQKYIKNLPFNGEFRNVALIDVLQQVEGVVIPELSLSQSKFGNNAYKKIDAFTKPDAGYFSIEDKDLNITYTAYNGSDL